MTDENQINAATEATELMQCDLSMMLVKHEIDTRSASSSNHSNSSQLYEKIALPRSQFQSLGVLGRPIHSCALLWLKTVAIYFCAQLVQAVKRL